MYPNAQIVYESSRSFFGKGKGKLRSLDFRAKSMTEAMSIAVILVPPSKFVYRYIIFSGTLYDIFNDK